MRRSGAFPYAIPALVFSLALVLTGGAGTAVAQEPVQVRGEVRHRDGRTMADVPVFLEVHDGQRVVQRLDARTGPDGSALFRDVRATESNVARLGTEYAGVTYYSEPLVVAADGARDLTVTVAEVTAEGRPLHLDTLHVIVQVDDPTRFQVLEFATVSNAGEAAWAGGPPLADGSPSGLAIPIPADATEIQPAPFPSEAGALPASSMEVQPGRVLDPRPVPPTGRQVALTYVLDATDGPADFRLALPYPTQSVSVLVGGDAAASIDFGETNLSRGDVQDIGGRTYEVWTAAALSPGDEVVLTMGRQTALISPRAWALIGLGVALALAVAGSFQGLRSGPDPAQVRDRILERIARLDLEREAGELADAEYQRRRAEEVERLLIVQSRLGAEAETGAGPETAAATDD